VTKLANVTYSISPSAIQAVKDTEAAAAAVGIQSTCYVDLDVQFGATDFTTDALAIKQNGCNGVEAPMVDNSDVALAGAIKNAGDGGTVKDLFYTGYGEDVLQNAGARAEYQGAYIQTNVNFTTPNPAVKKMLANLKKYDPGYKGGIPDYGVYNSYIAADLMIKGLELAGKNPTRPSFIANLHKLTDYTAEGIFPEPGVNFSLSRFGTLAMLPQTTCEYVVQLKGDAYVDLNGGKPYCGRRSGVAQGSGIARRWGAIMSGVTLSTPDSTGSTAAVIHRASSLARKAAAHPTSQPVPGVPSRPASERSVFM
jgi:Periplasmic binding protein